MFKRGCSWLCGIGSPQGIQGFISPAKGHLQFFLGAFAFVALYYTFSLSMFLFLYDLYGYYKADMSGTFDSTYIHTPAAIPVYIKYCMGPSCLVLFVLHYMSHVATSICLTWDQLKMQDEGFCKTWLRWVVEKANNCAVSSTSHRIGHLHLLRLYILFWSNGNQLLLYVPNKKNKIKT